MAALERRSFIAVLLAGASSLFTGEALADELNACRDQGCRERGPVRQVAVNWF
jgi:hypothetical protein